MAYDEQLADRIRDLIGPALDVTEQQMFGGLAFLVGGHLAIAASGQGGVLVRVGPAAAADLVERTPAEIAVMGGRAMAGWLRVGAAEVSTPRRLSPWVDAGVTFARTLPPKTAKRRRRPPV